MLRLALNHQGLGVLDGVAAPVATHRLLPLLLLELEVGRHLVAKDDLRLPSLHHLRHAKERLDVGRELSSTMGRVELGLCVHDGRLAAASVAFKEEGHLVRVHLPDPKQQTALESVEHELVMGPKLLAIVDGVDLLGVAVHPRTPGVDGKQA